ARRPGAAVGIGVADSLTGASFPASFVEARRICEPDAKLATQRRAARTGRSAVAGAPAGDSDSGFSPRFSRSALAGATPGDRENDEKHHAAAMPKTQAHPILG